MSPVHKQGRAKARRRSVQINGPNDEVEQDERWRCPPLDECDDNPPEPMQLPEASVEDHRLMVRMIYSLETGEFVRFAVIQETKYQGRWRHVVEVDTCHDVDVHLHQYRRSTFTRNDNDPEVIHEVHAVDDIQTGYNLTYERVVEMWQENLRRWRDG